MIAQLSDEDRGRHGSGMISAGFAVGHGIHDGFSAWLGAVCRHIYEDPPEEELR